MKKFQLLVTIAALSAAVYFGTARTSVHAATTYAAGSVKGSYGFTEQGTFGQNNPITGLGIVNTDGAGGLWGSETIQTVGAPSQTLQFTGTYSVNGDGTGTFVFMYTNPLTDSNTGQVIGATQGTYNFVLVNNQTQLQSIRADNNLMVASTFTRQ
jgi:hypothetical protein